MWEELKNAAKGFVGGITDYLANRTFILSLFEMPTEQAHSLLRQKIDAMDQAAWKNFQYTLSTLMNEAQQAVQRANSTSSWGPCIEDRMAETMARISTGVHSSSTPTAEQNYLQVLQVIANLTEQFRHEKALNSMRSIR